MLHSADAAFRTHLPRARCIARLFLSLRCSFLTSSLQSQTRQRKLLVSGLAIPGCARADSFRLRDFRGVAGAQGLRFLNRYNPFASTCSTSLPGRPDSHVLAVLPSVAILEGSASGGMTVISRPNLIPSATCRAVPACLLAVLLLREMSADAATPERAKPPSHPILTHASAYCQEGPASPARS